MNKLKSRNFMLCARNPNPSQQARRNQKSKKTRRRPKMRRRRSRVMFHRGQSLKAQPTRRINGPRKDLVRGLGNHRNKALTRCASFARTMKLFQRQPIRGQTKKFIQSILRKSWCNWSANVKCQNMCTNHA